MVIFLKIGRRGMGYDGGRIEDALWSNLSRETRDC